MKRNVNISLKTIGWIAGVIGLGVLSISAINLKKGGILRGITVDVIQFDGGDYFLTQEDVKEEVLAMTGPIESRRLDEIDPSTMEDALQFNPFIKQADVYVSSDRDLMVIVQQRKPILRVFDSSGDSYYIDREGMRIPVSPHFTARVIVANGHIAGNDVVNVSENEQLDGLHHLVRAIDEDAFIKSLIEQIYVTRSGDVQLVPKIGDIRIDFGEIDRVPEKLENLKVFYTEVLRQEGWGNYESINLDYRGQIVCKKSQT